LLTADAPTWSAFWFQTALNPSVIVDNTLKTIEVNRRGRELLSDNRGLFLRDGALCAKDRKIGLQLEHFVATLTAEAVNTLAVLDFLIMGRRLGDGAPAALQFRDLRRHIELDCADLEPVFGVTRAEHQTLLCMLRGHSVTRIAADLDKSVLTVRTHVKRLYAKLGVQSREQLFARIAPFLFLSRTF
jgi:DNA-binding CsgD family transcriptional regulator